MVVLHEYTHDCMETPKEWREFLVRYFNVNLDVAADPSNAICERFYSEHTTSCFKQDWPIGEDDVCFLHPPYSKAEKFIRFGTWQSHRVGCKLIILFKAHIHSPLWQDHILPYARFIFFPRGKFDYVFKGKVMGQASMGFAFAFFNIKLTVEQYIVMKQRGSILIPHPEMVNFNVLG